VRAEVETGDLVLVVAITIEEEALRERSSLVCAASVKKTHVVSWEYLFVLARKLGRYWSNAGYVSRELELHTSMESFKAQYGM
jgi:hypothetical protein